MAEGLMAARSVAPSGVRQPAITSFPLWMWVRASSNPSPLLAPVMTTRLMGKFSLFRSGSACRLGESASGQQYGARARTGGVRA